MLLANILFIHTDATEDCCGPDFAGAAKQSRYVASSGSHSIKYSELKHKVFCIAGQFNFLCTRICVSSDV